MNIDMDSEFSDFTHTDTNLDNEKFWIWIGDIQPILYYIFFIIIFFNQ